MATKQKNVLAYMEGPYEQWALGIGASYVDGAADVAVRRRYAAIVTLPAPVAATNLPKIDGPAGAKKISEPRLPTIWGLSSGIKHRFLPVILDVSSRSRKVDYRSILNWMASFTALETAALKPGDAIVKAGKPVNIGLNLALESRYPVLLGNKQPSASSFFRAIEEPGVRLNVPVPEDTIDHIFSQAQPPSDIGAAMGRAPVGAPKGKPAVVITAIIDDGIAFAHRNFRDRGGKSRIESCWLQSAGSDGSGRVLFGRELYRREIDDLLADAGGDEDQAYASIPMSEADARYGAMMHRSATHGTHVLDIAAGHRHGCREPRLPAFEGEGLDRVRIIAVQLPPSAIADTAGFGKDAYFLSAFHHVFERADAVFEAYGVTNPRDQWLTVNFSYGATGGPHDGTGRMERAIQELVEQRTAQGKPTHVIMPAGNTFSGALYGEIQPRMLDSGNAFTIPWRVQPNSRAASHLELWFPANPAGASLEIMPPGSDVICSLSLDSSGRIEFPGSAQRYGQVSLSEASRGAWCAVVSLAPTEPGRDTLPTTPAGLWRIRFRQPKENRFENPVCCRIQRSESPSGFVTGARQSYFDDPQDAPFNDTGALAAKDTPGAFVRRFGSLNGLAIGESIWIVGGVYADSLQPTDASAAGPSRRRGDSNHPFIDLSAPSDDARVLPGRLAAGTLSGSTARLSGTSAASPFVARQVALAALTGCSFPIDIHKLHGATKVRSDRWRIPHAHARLGSHVLTDPDWPIPAELVRSKKASRGVNTLR